ncbi:hypothetical protein AIOL_000823 [Candidatus Rhodobacter oscarellae]|uniref:YjiS-like domain-containing protein n=1 Tax=Candidatus Rhodobacter oscarellae TaxID=1675527 RepID=A0A0J9EG69_9RHOB|nr:DUF1127 domain-containing protein [Candidatus Rhodobacter lobularis]KMW60659.1 hypothetical protein AIOL_000823 [Candidatus Rhodobacter lobularis]
MALFDTSRPVVANTGIGAAFANIFSGLMAAVASWNDARVTRNTLSQLSDRQLDDLGLSRGNIDELFRG